MKVSVIGTGYVGLVSGVCLAEQGHQVVCVDKDADKVEKIRAGVSPIYEAGLSELLKKNVGARLHATVDLAGAVRDSELSLVAVGTPFDGSAIDIGYVRQAAAEIGAALKDKRSYHAVVVKSTVVPGTTDGVVLPILEESSGKRAGRDFGVGMNPEFLSEGIAIADFMQPDRIVLGGIDERTHEALQQLYEPFTGADVITTSNKTAEMIKYTANSLLATLISFSNEIANLCSTLGGMDAKEVMKGVHLDKRFSPILADGQRITPGAISYLEAGCGFGGSCFPKDVKALVAHGRQHGYPLRLLQAVVDINQEQPRQVLKRLNRHFPSLKNVPVAVLGLAFKPATDDMRESPAIPIVNALLEQGATVSACDPVAEANARNCFGNNGIRYCGDVAQAIEGAAAILVLTRWDEFRELPALLRRLPKQPLVIDGRRMLDRHSVDSYDGIGL